MSQNPYPHRFCRILGSRFAAEEITRFRPHMADKRPDDLVRFDLRIVYPGFDSLLNVVAV
jgi:hypothetical protein